MKNKSFLPIPKAIKNQVFSTLLATLLIAVSWAGGVIFQSPVARALTLDSPPLVFADSNPIDTVFGAGTSDRIQGKAQEDIGTVERKVGDLKGEAKGAARQFKGRAQRDLGKVKNRADRAGSELEEASDNLGDAIEDFLGQ